MFREMFLLFIIGPAFVRAGEATVFRRRAGCLDKASGQGSGGCDFIQPLTSDGGERQSSPDDSPIRAEYHRQTMFGALVWTTSRECDGVLVPQPHS